MSGYQKPWRRPRKVSPDGRKFQVNVELSEDQLDLIRAHSQGFSLLELSGAYFCDKKTILQTLREIEMKIANSAKPAGV